MGLQDTSQEMQEAIEERYRQHQQRRQHQHEQPPEAEQRCRQRKELRIKEEAFYLSEWESFLMGLYRVLGILVFMVAAWTTWLSIVKPHALSHTVGIILFIVAVGFFIAASLVRLRAVIRAASANRPNEGTQT